MKGVIGLCLWPTTAAFANYGSRLTAVNGYSVPQRRRSKSARETAQSTESALFHSPKTAFASAQ